MERIDATGYLPSNKAEMDLQDIDLADRASESLLVAESTPAGAVAWVAAHRETILAGVAAKGWILLRGLKVTDPVNFRECVAALEIPLVDHYGDLPMMPADDGTTGVFNVTKYPSKNAILFHNEGSHTNTPPRHIFFQCTVSAPQGGETPVTDCSDVLAALPQELRTAFAERGLSYRRNFIPGLDVTWQKYFGTADREAVERLCAQHNATVRWREGDGLETEVFRPAVITHPVKGTAMFFNQVLLHHPACLEPSVRSAMARMLNGESFPRNVLFGNGEPIPEEWIAEVLRAHLRVAKVFHWQPGDIVAVDNHAVAHARRPYTGPRQHHVILARE